MKATLISKVSVFMGVFCSIDAIDSDILAQLVFSVTFSTHCAIEGEVTSRIFLHSYTHFAGSEFIEFRSSDISSPFSREVSGGRELTRIEIFIASRAPIILFHRKTLA